jgi:nucleotide-binding universal stress UspA family protein
MENKKVILVPTDFSKVCYNAIVYGAGLAGFLGYTLAILHVIDKKSKAELKKENLTDVSVDEKLKKLAAEIEKKHKVQTSFIAREGSIFNTIGEVAGEIRASLVVLGTHGKVGIQQKLAGSYAKKVLITSPAPVIVIQKGSKFTKKFNNVIFPVSTTAEVRQKVRWMVMIAKAFQSTIHLFQLHQTIEEDVKKMNVIIRQIIKEFESNGIEYKLVAAEKRISFSKQLQEYAHKTKAELITIMTTPDAVSFMLSQYDEQMIFNQYEIPVFCVNPIETKVMHWF